MSQRSAKQSRVWIPLTLAVIALAAAEIAGQQASQPRLLHPGTFYESQIEAGIEGQWLALVPYGSRDELESREVTVRRIPDKDDPILNEVEILVRGLEQEPHTVFLVRGVAALAPAVVREARIECGSCALPEPDLVIERQVRLSLDGKNYDLEVNPLDKTQTLDRTSILTLRSGDRRQVLYRFSDEPDEPSWPVLWAGDLDRDGRLDLYMDLSRKYSMSRRVLFLSSKAAGNDLVGEAAVFETTGA
jgi:hypothetical protein